MIVLADGCFDPIHIGHLRYLEVAASLGELYVNVASDETIRAKGREPFQTRIERAESLSRVQDVREAFWYWSLLEAIANRRPDFLVKGIEWQNCLPADVLTMCAKTGTHVVFTQTRSRTSTERLSA